MKFYNNLKIGTKILTGFILVCILTGILGLYSILSMGTINQGGNGMYTSSVLPLEELSSAQVNIIEVKNELLAATYEKNTEKTDEHESNINKYISNNTELLAPYDQMEKDAEESTAYDKYKTDFNSFEALSSQVISLLKAGKYDEAVTNLDEITTSIEQVNSDLEGLISLQTHEADTINTMNMKTYMSSTTASIVIIVISLFAALLIGLYLSITLRRRLKKVKDVTDRIVLGDTDIDIKSTSKDEIGEIADSYMILVAKTKNEANIVKQISDGNFNIEVKPSSDKDILGLSLAVLLDTVKNVTLQMNNLVQAVSEGRLKTRSDTKGFKGDWNDMAKGQNNLMDTFMENINIVIEYLDGMCKGIKLPKITFDSKGDWIQVRDNINGVYDALHELVADINMLSEAGAEGILNKRADASRHQGNYGIMVEGINKMLESIINPLNECEEVLGELAKGNLQTAVKGNYKGEMAVIKDAVNYIGRGVYSHIEETSKVLKEMANGNLDVEITGEYHGDFVELKESTNKIIASFNETLGEINTAAEQVSAGTKQVSDSSQSLSQGSTEQAASIEEITSTVTEIAAQTKENAANAGKANEMAESVKKNAGEGNKEMQGVLKAMEEINVSSNNISKIIKVIDDIAFQTNILALNAAVEAARAGQHGKGFAVVAEEVRNLAARSADAAKETTGMIEESIKKAENGKKITELTADALNKVVENIAAVADIVSGIAVASNDQATAIGQINQAIEEVSKVTQSNTATAEETASASEELSSQAVLVKERVGRFILKRGSMSQSSYRNLDDKTLNILQAMLSNKNETAAKANPSHAKTAAASSPKISISLDDTEFGKY